MLMNWIRIFLIIVLVAAIMGFTGVTASKLVLDIARGIFGVFLVLFVITIFVYISSGKN